MPVAAGDLPVAVEVAAVRRQTSKPSIFVTIYPLKVPEADHRPRSKPSAMSRHLIAHGETTFGLNPSTLCRCAFSVLRRVN
jgi:hypothetical protein